MDGSELSYYVNVNRHGCGNVLPLKMKHTNNTKYEKLPQLHTSKELNGETTGSPDSGTEREVSTVRSRSVVIDYWITVGSVGHSCTVSSIIYYFDS